MLKKEEEEERRKIRKKDEGRKKRNEEGAERRPTMRGGSDRREGVALSPPLEDKSTNNFYKRLMGDSISLNGVYYDILLNETREFHSKTNYFYSSIISVVTLSR